MMVIGEIHHSTPHFWVVVKTGDRGMAKFDRHHKNGAFDVIVEGTKEEAQARVQAYHDTWKRLSPEVEAAQKRAARLVSERADFARAALTGMEPRGSFGPLSEDQCRSLAGIK